LNQNTKLQAGAKKLIPDLKNSFFVIEKEKIKNIKFKSLAYYKKFPLFLGNVWFCSFLFRKEKGVSLKSVLFKEKRHFWGG